MASINTDGGDGLNVELNLVPFIDLLSTLTLFLLVTAVWYQVSAIQTKTESKGRATASASVVPPKRLSVHVSRGSMRISLGGESQTIAGSKDALKSASAKYLKRNISQAAVTADGGVEYGQVVGAVDALKETGFERVALSTQ